MVVINCCSTPRLCLVILRYLVDSLVEAGFSSCIHTSTNINIPIVTLVYNSFSLMFDMNPIYLPGRHIENVIVP
jgi:hypothetical protein